MLADSQIFPISTHNFNKIGPAVSKEIDNKHRDMLVLYIRCIIFFPSLVKFLT